MGASKPRHTVNLAAPPRSPFPSKPDMPSTTLSNRRIAIFEDNPLNRERLSDMVTRCGATALPVNGPAPRLNGLKAFLQAQQANMVVCDHHLSQKKDYAPFLGAEAVAMCYRGRNCSHSGNRL